MNTELNEIFRSINGLVLDIDEIMEKSENKEETFLNLMWHIPNGLRYQLDLKMIDNIKSLINTTSEGLDVNAEEVLKENSVTDWVELLKNGLSNIEIETKPTEEPTDDPTEEPTEDPTIWDGESIEEPDFDEETQTYLIKTAANLAWLAETITKDNTEGKTYKLEDDIDLNGNQWNPIGQTTGIMGGNANRISFRGTFDGNNHTISNFTTDVKDELAKSGLFASLEGIVKNLKVTDATIKSTHYAAVIAAYNTDTPCLIENCQVENCTVTTMPEYSTGKWDNGDKAGSIIGYVRGNDSVIKGCKAKNVEITAYRDLGGIAGYISASETRIITLENNSVENVILTQNYEHGYKAISDVEGHMGANYGWKDGIPTVIGETGEVTTKEINKPEEE